MADRLVDRTDFHEKLRAVRVAAGLSQAELASRAGVHPQVVSKLERGIREPTWPTALKLAGALGVSVAAFEGEVQGSGPEGGKGTTRRPRGGPPGKRSAKANGRRPKRTE
jgi:transcriptional regulator with XRE-family HTH domain